MPQKDMRNLYCFWRRRVRVLSRKVQPDCEAQPPGRATPVHRAEKTVLRSNDGVWVHRASWAHTSRKCLCRSDLKNISKPILKTRVNCSVLVSTRVLED